MVRLVIVKNPFAPAEGRIVKLIECEGTSIEELLKQYAIEGVELQATINGYMVEGRTKVRSGDFVVLFPVIAKGGGKVLGVIAAVALSVVSFGVGGLVSGVGWSALGATARLDDNRLFVSSSGNVHRFFAYRKNLLWYF